MFTIVGVGAIAGAWMFGETLGGKIFLTIWGSAFVLGGVLATAVSLTSYNTLCTELREGRALRVEGIAHYTSESGLPSDRLLVGSVAFKYGAGSGSPSYDRTRVAYGENLEGRCLIVRYVETPPGVRTIVRLSINTAGCAPPIPAPQAGPQPRT